VKTLVTLLLLFPLSFQVLATGESEEKAVQHIKLADVTSAAQAKKVFLKSTSDIKSKKKLDAAELHEIHFITYSLEKSVAFYAENLSGDRQELAKEMAEVVEFIHINSENNRKEKTKKYLNQYFDLAAQFSSEF